MSKIISFGNQKGGVGKSTLTVMCANALSQHPFNYNVCIVDCDNQKSIVETRKFDQEDYEEDFPYEVYDMDIPLLQAQLNEMDKTFDFIFIDAAGKLDKELPIEQQEISKILMYVDYLFLPFRAGTFNLDATLTYLEFVQKVYTIRKENNRPLHLHGLINMYRLRSRMNRFLIQEVEEVKKFANISFMENSLNNYTLYEDVDTITSYYEVNSKNKSKINFTLWFNELIKIIF